jgi:hypothetical protein
MPGGDRTGPQGGGPKTGQGLGDCTGSEQPGSAGFQPAGLGFRRGGRGRGRGYSRGRGWRSGFGSGRGRGDYVVSSETQDQEIDSLKAQAAELGNALQEIQARLSALEPEDEGKE